MPLSIDYERNGHTFYANICANSDSLNFIGACKNFPTAQFYQTVKVLGV